MSTAPRAAHTDILSVREAAAELDLSISRVQQLIDSGQLPATFTGGWAVRRGDLERVRERRPPGRPPKARADES